MKQHLTNAYRKSEQVRWSAIVAFALIALWLFDIRVAMYTIIVSVLAHEIPTLFIGLVITKEVRKELK